MATAEGMQCLSSSEEKSQLLQILHTVCQRLDQLGEDAVVLTTIAEHTFGTSGGLKFFANNPTLQTDFLTWCHGQRLSASTGAESIIDSLVTCGETSDTQAGLPAEVVVESGEENNSIDDFFPRADSVKVLSDNLIEAGADHVESYPVVKKDPTSLIVSPEAQVKSEDVNVKTETERNSSIESSVVNTPLRHMILSLVSKNVEVNGENVELLFPEEIENMRGKYGESECVKCGKSFKTSACLKEHLSKLHSVKMGYKCICSKYYSDSQSFETHVHSQNFKSTHMDCDKLEVLFDQTSDLISEEQDSIRDEDLIGEFTCQKCETVFKHRNHLLTHSKKFADCVEKLKSKDISIQEKRNLSISYNVNGTLVTKTLKQLMTNIHEGKFICPVCLSEFSIKSSFARHLTSHADSNLYCEICGLRMRCIESLTKHLKGHLDKPYDCDHCRQRFKSATLLKYHIRKVCRGGDREDFKCDLCPQVSASMSALQKHKNMHLGIRAFGCDRCGKKMSTQHSLERHVATMHSQDTPFQCSMCPRAFKTKDNLRKHTKTHEVPKYHCEICGKTCTESGNLKKHMMTHTKEKPFVCEVCGKPYGRKALLDNHRRIHTGEKPFQCEEENCGKCFRSYANLTQHARTHSQTSPFICDICGRTFKQPGRLNHHRKDHVQEYRWICLYCPAKFKSIFMYKSHLAKNHPEMKTDVESKTNIRLYQCHLCSRVYGDKEDLTRHLYIHNGTKPFECSICNKAFNDRSNMKQHEKTHINKKTLSCECCHKTFTHVKTLKMHEKTCPEFDKDVKFLQLSGPTLMDQSVVTIAEDNSLLLANNVELEDLPDKYQPTSDGMVRATVQLVPSDHLSGQHFTAVQPNAAVGFVQPLMVVNNLPNI